MKNAGIAAGLGAATGLGLYGSFKLFAWVFDEAVGFVCRRRDAWQEGKAL